MRTAYHEENLRLVEDSADPAEALELLLVDWVGKMPKAQGSPFPAGDEMKFPIAAALVQDHRSTGPAFNWLTPPE